MDPLSIATGVITLIGACNALASTIKKLHQLREAPKELDDLEKELSALQSCTEGVNQLIQTHDNHRRGIVGRMSIGLYVENAHQKIEQIQHFLDRRLLDLSSRNKIRRSAWFKWRSEFERLRQELRDVRSEIGTCICLLNAAEGRENELQLQEIAFEGRAMHERQLKTLESLREELITQRPALAAELGMRLGNMSQNMQTIFQEGSWSSGIPVAGLGRSADQSFTYTDSSSPILTDRLRGGSDECSRISERHDELPDDSFTSSQPGISLSASSRWYLKSDSTVEGPQVDEVSAGEEPTLSLQVSHRQRKQCRRPCSCQCHRSSKLKTPDFLRHFTGQLLVGYTGISSMTPPCNEHACAQRQQAGIRVQYNFPVWSLIQRVLTLVSYSGGLYGPEKMLRMSRIRPGLDEVFIQVQSGNVRRLQQLFIQGSASPLDASDTGWTLLHYALSAGQLPTAKFLKDSGADVRAESTSRETPINVAWNRILSGCLDVESEHLLRSVFDDDSQLDERQFTTLHKIVLGMIGKDLTEELGVTTAHINAIDSSGNTSLSWASARGDSKSVMVLLEHGASLGIANDVNINPIHLAAQTGNIPTVRALVQAGADVNSVVRQTQMTPIHYAAEYQNNAEQIHGLASLGALIDGKDYLSWTPLHWASWRGHVHSLNALLDWGADVNAKTLDSNAPIMLAVANNSHECIRRLIEAGADCSIVRDSQWNILHYAAIGGSVDTLQSLVKADLSRVDIQDLRTKDTGQTVNDMLHMRLEALSFAEEDLEKRATWESAWDCLMSPKANQSCGTELGQDINPPLVRSTTDSTYVDADDQPFECRSEQN
ncbi:MAG: hypothetical protein Q9223_002415 [Gallowayella weberi]